MRTPVLAALAGVLGLVACSGPSRPTPVVANSGGAGSPGATSCPARVLQGTLHDLADGDAPISGATLVIANALDVPEPEDIVITDPDGEFEFPSATVHRRLTVYFAEDRAEIVLPTCATNLWLGMRISTQSSGETQPLVVK